MYDNKTEQLREEIKIFERSQRNVQDYLKLSVTVWSVTKQGSGLTFSQMEEIIEEALEETKTPLLCISCAQTAVKFSNYCIEHQSTEEGK